MAGYLIEPTITAEINGGGQGGGQVDLEATTSGSFPDWTGGNSAFQNYKYKAQPDAGFDFLRFVIVTGITQYWNGGSYTYYYTNNRDGVWDGEWFTYETDVAGTADVNKRELDAPWWSDYVYCPGLEDFYVMVTAVKVQALFARQSYVHSNLLVNSYNKSTPIRLLWDDRAGGTGRLIADF